MRSLLSSLWEMQKKVFAWCHREFQRSADSFSDDLRSMRIFIIWILIALFIWVVIWSVLFFGGVSGVCSTAIVTCGGIVSWALSNYVVSRQHEKRLEHEMAVVKLKNGFKKPVKPESSEDEGSA